MKKLIIDTATKNLYLALVIDDKVHEVIMKNEKEHSKNILIAIDNLLVQNNVDIQELNSIYVGIGPGSYTGVRIGVSVAKMFAWTLSIPLYEISSLFIMCSKYKDGAAMIDARRGNVFCGAYGINQTEEMMRVKDDFIKNDFLIVDEDNYSPDYKRIIENAKEVNPHTCCPNYLRETEAERNIKG